MGAGERVLDRANLRATLCGADIRGACFDTTFPLGRTVFLYAAPRAGRF
ncbi:MAG TPA: hypothetical protein VFJ85_17225 [Acidimicrobiales bacterium]|nr:hypothetical protein [Acidimicrobiales bacterium]